MVSDTGVGASLSSVYSFSRYAIQDELKTAGSSVTCGLVTLVLHICSYVPTQSPACGSLRQRMLLNCADLDPQVTQVGADPGFASPLCIIRPKAFG
jgi:hypothetical protein